MSFTHSSNRLDQIDKAFPPRPSNKTVEMTTNKQNSSSGQTADGVEVNAEVHMQQDLQVAPKRFALFISKYISHLMSVSSLPGLSGCPLYFYHICEEVGIAGRGWEDLGKPWHAIATLWLRAEVMLSKIGHPDLKYAEIQQSTLPEALKDW